MEPILEKISTPWQVLVQTATWTILLMITVSLASFAPEMAFVSKIKSSSDGFVRIPMDLSGEMLILPSEMVKNSSLDVFIPTIFAGVMVIASVSLLRSCLGIEGVVVEEIEEQQC
ncbi:uncharacterized protein LOC9315250 [Arabidopsis lyrata subsp. lyrata]|nr:uncharacterized protein LOC9315250 [Arabidopsis lyrata subsp. lyrata]|eukprot:XP_002879183.2 uncharacterized protein LOC9315250 [Arabidopsis lyrata subsp. lyrata]